MTNLYLLNEDTNFQFGCNDVCRRIYNHLASLHRENGKFRSSVKTLASALGYSESGIRYWLFLMRDAKVITLTRRSNHYDFDVNHNVAFITSNH
ncbi:MULTISPECIES: hypothetical protein [Enterobacteriaceae]|uniref:Helix-turn-helix domain-containing protein n=1 Tax=Klebsiella michiganensis TaxID=1134687 RepID=A0ABR5GLA1_9ENTR|nr:MULTISPECIES: hypothetical protein [Enterobacteriaceae]EJC0204338.1 hypothetical protein [Serratia marcescens]EKT9307135.1 hypothetical protein [Citrobacter freundii]HAS1811500.1 hypothetical protein [Enterobacter hormaechei subsp. xiangfangensis]EMF22021.1 hypothetical protein H262_15817 [Citrobacter freundii GTC 09479]EWF74996.1 hypothetical protein L387_01009 [Klebsiella michiganensis]